VTEHLSHDDIARYVDGTLDAGGLLRADDHLASCAACRRLVPADRVGVSAAAVRAAVRTDVNDLDHPAHDVIVAYVDDSLDAVDREIVESHVAVCRMCAEDVADLRAVAVERPESLRDRSSERLADRSPERLALQREERSARLSAERRRLFYLTAGLAAAAAFAGLLVWRQPIRRPPTGDVARTSVTPPATTSVTPPPPAVVLTLQDGDRTVTLDAAGSLTGVGALDTADRAVLAEALRSGRAPVPSSIAALGGRQLTLLGPTASASVLAPRTPVATAVDAARPAFEWTAPPDATSFVVAVFDQNLDKVAESEPLSTTRWTPGTPLPRGATYMWQIRARTAGGEVTAPAPPAPEARFAVLSREDADRVAAWRREYAASPLTLGVLLARVGLIGEAWTYLDRVAAANPGSREAQQLAGSVRVQADRR